MFFLCHLCQDSPIKGDGCCSSWPPCAAFCWAHGAALTRGEQRREGRALPCTGSSRRGCAALQKPHPKQHSAGIVRSRALPSALLPPAAELCSSGKPGGGKKLQPQRGGGCSAALPAALCACSPCRLSMQALCACCPCSLPIQHTLLPPLQATVVHSSRRALVALGEILDMQTVSDCTQPNIAAVNLVQGYLWCKSLNEKILFASPIACGTAGMVQGWEGAWLQGGSSFGRESLSSIGKP